jgi:hypothetical protein
MSVKASRALSDGVGELSRQSAPPPGRQGLGGTPKSAGSSVDHSHGLIAEAVPDRHEAAGQVIDLKAARERRRQGPQERVDAWVASLEAAARRFHTLSTDVLVTETGPRLLTSHLPPDPIEMRDAAWECEHGSLPHDRKIACCCWDLVPGVASRRARTSPDQARPADRPAVTPNPLRRAA